MNHTPKKRIIKAAALLAIVAAISTVAYIWWSSKDTPGTFIDSRDGKRYRLVVIGKQTWMAENLNYNANSSKCFDNKSANCKKYGRLYDWETAKTVCPEGWHLPSDAEWQTLIDYAGGNEIAGNKLKAKSEWGIIIISPSETKPGDGTDEFGFSALPGDYGKLDGSFGNDGFYGYWWGNSSNGAYGNTMNYNKENVVWGYYDKLNLFSVRCVRDYTASEIEALAAEAARAAEAAKAVEAMEIAERMAADGEILETFDIEESDGWTTGGTNWVKSFVQETPPTRLVAYGGNKKYNRAVHRDYVLKIRYIGLKKMARERGEMQYDDDYWTSRGFEYEILGTVRDNFDKDILYDAILLYNDAEEKRGGELGVLDSIKFSKRGESAEVSKDDIAALEKQENGRKIISSPVIDDFSIGGKPYRLMLVMYENKGNGLFKIVLRDPNSGYFTADFPCELNDGVANWRADLFDDPGIWDVLFIGRVAEGLIIYMQWRGAEGINLEIFVARNGKLENWRELTSGGEKEAVQETPQ
jgi:uncharacterized protein (TIGR02145 family)